MHTPRRRPWHSQRCLVGCPCGSVAHDRTRGPAPSPRARPPGHTGLDARVCVLDRAWPRRVCCASPACAPS
eukprot:1365652-Prymnesium_polylepis.1